MARGKKPVKKKKGKKQVKKKKTEKKKKKVVAKEKMGTEKIVFLGHTMTWNEKIAIEDIKKKLPRIYKKYFNLETSKGKVTRLDINHLKIKSLPASIGNLKSLKRLYLRGNQLTTLPGSIGNLKSLRELDLRSNQLKTLPESFGNLTNLRKLYIADNELLDEPSVKILGKLVRRGVKTEKISYLKATVVYQGQRVTREDKQALEDLKELNVTKPRWRIEDGHVASLILSEKGLTTLPESIGNLKSLETLDLMNNEIITLPESIKFLEALRTLWLNNNKLITLPESIGNLKNLQNLVLHENELSTLPESIGNLQSLYRLRVDNNKLTALPESIGNLKSLRELNLRSNQFKTLPESFGNLKSLRKLNLRSNQFKTLPESVGNLKSLEELILYDNPLNEATYKILEKLEFQGSKIRYKQYKEFTEHRRYQDKLITVGEKQALVALEKSINRPISPNYYKEYREFGFYAEKGRVTGLFLENEKLTSLPEIIGDLKSLEVVSLDGNQLDTLPESIYNLESLQQMHLDNNRLIELSERIGDLKSLKLLDVQGNQLVTIPDSIGNLKSLQILDLKNNQITTLPESIGDLKSLQVLDLKNNQLTTLPESTANLNLKYLLVINNKFTSRPKSKLLTEKKKISGRLLKAILLGHFNDKYGGDSKIEEYRIHRRMEPATGSIDIEHVGRWLWIKFQAGMHGREWDPSTDRVLGDPVSLSTRNDWIGLAESASANFFLPEEFDGWALYATTLNPGPWGETRGRYVENVSENGIVTVQISSTSTVEKVDLNELLKAESKPKKKEAKAKEKIKIQPKKKSKSKKKAKSKYKKKTAKTKGKAKAKKK